MTSPNLVLLYVEDPTRSAQFYERLLGRRPVAAFPTYAAFALDNGLHLGLWSTHANDFVSGGTGHRSELAFMVDDKHEVERLYDAWKALGVSFEQPPMTAVFGLTFVALDPDGHRLRVCMPDK
ncbi:glyoxalase [Burkholderia stabilis]|uniref:VOC family protein n=1 Tax=Burkholderia stabilis TaxID=95485 RepID=UPI000852002C|nr:VOC family protein [Burkholderia stabilis]AOR70615.1 glyoxalase [Burkholderia stabilis]HDR9492124.1 VOC family protein [Burkholderia stabilis]HDR9522368.1 VOC family protein [Burkholderia stabilis]HDR9530222.1 VOC family protein [Burkholderia stabilis]HDR9539746.1 VOC family protein [Burkholderia stabilis]